LFQPVFTPKNLSDVAICIDELVGRGVILSNITVLAIVAARPVLWTFQEKYSDVCIVCSAVDEISTHSKGGSSDLVPGFALFEERSKKKKTQK